MSLRWPFGHAGAINSALNITLGSITKRENYFEVSKMQFKG